MRLQPVERMTSPEKNVQLLKDLFGTPGVDHEWLSYRRQEVSLLESRIRKAQAELKLAQQEIADHLECWGGG